MDDDEYFVDKNGDIHGNDCPRKDVPWFTKKHSKYDILIMDEQEICSDCLLFEEDKLYLLHRVNLKDEIIRLRRGGATEDYIKEEVKLYKHPR